MDQVADTHSLFTMFNVLAAAKKIHCRFMALSLTVLPNLLHAANTEPTPPPATTLYDRVVEAYLTDKWDELDVMLNAQANDLATLTAPQAADVSYIRQALVECRPTWWAQSKKHSKFLFHPVIWERPFDVIFDPDSKTSLQVRLAGSHAACTVVWDVADMDNSKPAEHGFSKGELNNLSVWMVVGNVKGWSDISAAGMGATHNNDKNRIPRFLDFCGNIAGLYYAQPRSRRWGFYLYSLAYTEKYAKLPTVMARQALGAMFAAEIVAHPEQYPSLTLPNTVPDTGTELAVVLHLTKWIEGHPWTLAEDRHLRETIKALVLANDKTLLSSDQVKLANGTVVSLDPDKDQPHREKRDAWMTTHINPAPIKVP